MSSNPRKVEESKPQPQASVIKFQAIVDNPHFTETQKRDLLRSMMQRQLKKGDESFMNTNSPSTQGFLGTLAAINECANTPDRPFLRRQQYNDFIAKKVNTLLQSQMELPLAPQGESSGPRKLEFPKCTIPVMQVDVTNTISKVDSNSVASQVEKGNETIPPSRTTVGNNDYFRQDLNEWVPNNVAEALYMMGPTAELKRTSSHKGRTRTGYQSKLFHCAIKGCSMRWLVQAAEWHGSDQHDFVNPSHGKHKRHEKTTWHGSNPYVFVKPSHENHNGHENVTWEDHFNHLASHGSKETCDQCEIFRTGIGLPPILKLEVRKLVLSNPEYTPKGTSDVRGLIIINRSMQNTLQVEFPRMIDTLSKERIIPNTDFHPTLDVTLAFSNNNFLKLLEEYLADGTTVQYNGGWLVNDTEFLGEPITPQSISSYETSLLGVFHGSYTQRREFVTNTNRYHHVLPATTKNGVPVHVCSCRHYWLHRWCYASWYIQHKDTLKNDSQTIVQKRKASKKLTESQRVSLAIQQKEQRKKARSSN
ncbi:hypothetical protein IV203_032436 [Nitzschia inconspicua]|uniref:Uncharacterized protein n=1 Tax=Nitzschia inconspicua TaxID=303405 RepID=A0A9K3PF00_9STRA|nr:hypothetical protein IV203_032436 [Nitzschia inconspicua]